MRITEIKGTAAASSVKKKSRDPSAAGFSELLGGSEETTTTSSIGGVGALTSLDGLLALQEIDNGSSNTEEQIQHGEDLLSLLDELQLSLLSGQITPQSVQQMLTKTQQQYNTNDDPKLKAIIEDIELRAEVELAKIEKNRTL